MPDLVGRKTAYFGFAGIIDYNGVTKLCAALNLACNKQYDEVYLCFSSLGGTIADAVFLYSHISALPIDITIHNTGTVASAAVTAFVGADKRYCSPHGMFLIHPTTLGPFQEAMPSERLQAALNAALAEDGRTENILREHTSIPDGILKDRRVKDVWIVPSDALKFGLVSEIKEFSLPKGNEIIQI
jgi:ATP-dependent Clp protease, protease subunit